MNNLSQENPSLLFKHKIFLLKRTQASLTWLQKPTFLQVHCSSLFYWYGAEDSPSVGDVTCRKMKLTLENNFKNLFASSPWILFISV